MTKFLTKISIATLSAALALTTPVALQAQTTTSTTTPTPSPTPTPSGCLSGCIPTTTFFAGAAGVTYGNAAVQGGYLQKDAQGNAQIVNGPGLTFTGKAQTDDYNHVVIEGGLNGKFCSTCVDTQLKITGNVGNKAQATGMVTSNVPASVLGVQSGTGTRVGFSGSFGIGGANITTTP